MIVETLLAGLPEALDACLSDGVAAAFVFVVWGDVADALMQADAVVVVADPGEFDFEHGGIGDRLEVWPFVLDVTEQGLDPGLIGGGVWSAVVLGDGHQRHELSGRVRGHLGSVVGDGEQDRAGRVIGWKVESFRGDEFDQAFDLEGVFEDDFHLRRGFLDRHQRVDPLA